MSGEIKLADETFTLGTTTYGFNFPPGGGNLGTSSASPFPARVVSGERSYADMDGFSCVAFTDLSGGMGLERATDPTRYYDGSFIDPRGGKIVLGPAVVLGADPQLQSYGASHSPASLLASNEFQVGSGPVVLANLGSVGPSKLAAKFTVGAASSITGIQYVFLPLACTVSATAITVAIYSNNSGVPGTSLGSGSVYLPNTRTSGNWQGVAMTPKVTVVAGTTYWVVVEHNGPIAAAGWYGIGDQDPLSGITKVWNGTTWVNAAPGKAMMFWMEDGLLRPPGQARFIMGAGEDGVTRMWCYSGRHVYYMNGSSTPVIAKNALNVPQDTGADILEAVWFRGTGDAHPFLYCALNGSDMSKYNGNVAGAAEAWTAAATGIQARRLCVQDKVLWRASSSNQVSASLDGATFGSGVGVGEATYPIERMVVWAGDLWVGKQDGLYKVVAPTGYPASGTPTSTKIIDFTALVDSNNFLVMLEHQGDLIFSIGQGLLKYTSGGVLTPITPDIGLAETATKRGYYTSAVSTMTTLWVALEGPVGEASGVLAYVDGHWHPVIGTPRLGDMIRGLAVDGGLYGETPRLWMSIGLQQAYCQIPTNTKRRWLYPGILYSVRGQIDLPWIDGNIRTIDKDWVEVEIDIDDVKEDDGQSVEVSWRTEEGAAFEILGTITTSGVSKLAFPADSFGYKLQLRLFMWAGNVGYSNNTPKINAVVLKYVERPPDLRAFTRTYELSSRPIMRNGMMVPQNIGQQVTALETLRESKEQLTWKSWWGGTYTVHITDYQTSERREQTGEAQDTGTIIATVRLLMLSKS